YDFQIITQKDKFQVGDSVIYIPIDSILSEEVEKVIFPEGSKVVLNKSRVRQIRLRGLTSQGMVINPKELDHIVNHEYFKPEQDVSAYYNITKYEPEEKGPSQTLGKSTG